MTIKLFISYGSDDKNKMVVFRRAIQKKSGMEPIVIADRRSPGKSLGDKVREGIQEADYLVPILTNKSIKNQWVNQEIGYAKALKRKIFPIVEKSILDVLKGFVHKNDDLPYTFESSDIKNKEATNFRKSYNMLLSDIAKFEDVIDKEKSDDIAKNLKMTIKRGYAAKDIDIDKKITANTKLNLRIKLSSIDQIFRAYFLFETDKQESIWVGYTNLKDAEHITDNEHTIVLPETNKISYSIDENITKTIQKRFPNLSGKPEKIIKLRFRGDKQSDQVINYYYGFL